MNASLTGLLSRSLQANPLFATVASWPEADVRVLALGCSAVLGVLTLLTCWWRPALDRDFALLLTATVLLSPLGWLYYFVLALGPALAWWLHRPPLARWQIVVALLILPGWFCQSWWLLSYQPSALATVTLGSMYFWSVAALWLLLVLDGFAVGTYNKP